jgi:hypothetical protein
VAFILLSNDIISMKKKSNLVLSVITLMTALFIVFYSYILKYINGLTVKKCECSDNWKRDYIKYFSMAAIGVLVVSLVLVFIERLATLPRALKLLLNILRGVYFLAFLVFLGVLFSYTSNLSNCETGCKCSEDKMRTVMQYFSALVGGWILVALFHMLIIMIIIQRAHHNRIEI